MVTLRVRLQARADEFSLDVSFETSAGITALFGPSGAGKSLTLRHVAGLERGAGGRIELGARVLFDAGEGVHLAPRMRRVGMVFQEYALFPHMSAGANVGYGLGGMAPPEKRARIEELLEMVDLAGFADRVPASLSGGERQRVALARALAPEPELLLLDEPFAALDFRVRRGLRAMLADVQARSGIPMVLVTHALADVRHLSDHLVLLDGGRVVGAGPTAELMADPGSPEAAELLLSDEDP